MKRELNVQKTVASTRMILALFRAENNAEQKLKHMNVCSRVSLHYSTRSLYDFVAEHDLETITSSYYAEE
jgi:hypothetical protein